MTMDWNRDSFMSSMLREARRIRDAADWLTPVERDTLSEAILTCAWHVLIRTPDGSPVISMTPLADEDLQPLRDWLANVGRATKRFYVESETGGYLLPDFRMVTDIEANRSTT